MTPLKKTVKRETMRGYRPGAPPLVVTLEPGDLIGVREKNTRTTYYLPIAGVYTTAVKAEVLRKQRERTAARAAKKAR